MDASEDLLETGHDDGQPDAIEPAMDIDGGPRLGRYLLLDRLGVGGMGTVFLAYDPELDRKVAIKLLHAQSSKDRSEVRLLREAQAMARLSHANVALVFDVGRFGGEIFLAMEYVGGGTLREWLDQKSGDERGWRAVIEVFIQAGKGLSAAHEAGLIHRDFKPANVLMTEDGCPKVTDFGLVRVSEEASSQGSQGPQGPQVEQPTLHGREEHAGPRPESSASASVSASARASPSSSEALSVSSGLGSGSMLALELTQVGTAVGTPAYMAPEQLRGDPVDARSDQFSFCVALYEALWGASPFQGKDLASRISAVLADRRAERPRGRDVPDWLIPIVERGLHPESGQRWPSMRALLEALAADPALRRRRSRRILAGVGLALGLAAGLFGRERWRERSCADQAAVASQRWRDGAHNLEAALRAGGPSYAEANSARVEAGVLDWVSRWSQASEQLCRTTSVDEALRAQTQRCLSEQLDAFTGLLAVFEEQAGAQGIAAHAITAVNALPDPSLCADPRHIDDFVGAARCPSEQRLRLHRLRVLGLSGLYAEAEALGDAMLDDPALRGCDELEDQVLVITAGLALLEGDSDRAEASLQQALRRAGSRDDLPVTLAAAHGLADVASSRKRFESAEVWLELAGLFVERRGAQPAELIELRLAQAELLISAADYERAERELASARVVILDNFGEQHPTFVRLLADRGRLERARGHHSEAEVLLERTKQLAEQIYGPDHPEVVDAMINLGATLDESDPAVALGNALAALSKAEQIYGRVHPKSVSAAEAVATAQLALGHTELAREGFADVIDRIEQLPAPDPTRLGSAETRYGVVLRRLGDYEGAERALTRGVTLTEQALGPEHPAVAGALNSLGVTVDALGRVEEAVALQQRALAIYEAVDPNHRAVAIILDNVGMLELELGRKREALRDIERATTLARVVLGEDHPRYPDFLTDLALAEAANDQRERARGHFERGRALCASRAGPTLDDCIYLDAQFIEFLLQGSAQEQRLALDYGEAAYAQAEQIAALSDRATVIFAHAQALRVAGREERGILVAREALATLQGDTQNRRAKAQQREIRGWLVAESAEDPA